MRDYNVEGQLGLEPVPDCLGWATGNRCGECYICRMVDVFRGVWRVLRKDGTCWVNMGDSYAAGGLGHGSGKQTSNHGSCNGAHIEKARKAPEGLKPKDLVGIPWRLAFALQADGWYLRQDVIWAKKNSMPESVRDRCCKAHEYVFLLSKSPRYFFDAEAIREESQANEQSRKRAQYGRYDAGDGQAKRHYRTGKPDYLQAKGNDYGGHHRNLRSVWTIATQGFPGAHFATFPQKLVEPCIKAGTSEKGCCAKCGAPWERVVERNDVDQKANEVIQHNGVPGLKKGTAQDRVRSLSGSTYQRVTGRTTGWTPTCQCDAEVVPCTVLDPFAGSGTTGVVALSLFRKFAGIELNEEYLKDFIVPRLEAEAGRFKQIELFARQG